MKKLLLLFLIFVCSTSFGQIPSYYDDVNLSLVGQNLKDELAVKIIGTHTNFLSYTPGVWDALEQSDLDPNNPNNVLLIYGYNDTDGDPKTDRTRDKLNHGGSVGQWNREHSYPKSLGNPDLGTSGPGSDAHHLRACDLQMNSTRNNRKYAAGTGNATITPQGDFYPGDEWKGDVARMMMYMYLRYDTQCLPSNVGVGNSMPGDTNMIDLFLQWNVEDPVSIFEDNRNDVLASIQGNRNPFIDNPAFATQIWGGPQAEDRFGTTVTDTEAPSIPANLVTSGTTSSATVLTWTASTDNVGVTGYDIYQDNVLIASIGNNTTYNVSGLLSDTLYMFAVRAKDQAGNLSADSNSASAMTLPSSGGTNASDLFISEYIEGSSYNKALEVANFTGGSVDLSVYSIKKQTNGAGDWSTGYNLTGTLDNGSVFVLAHSSASGSVAAVANATTTSTEITFNGNDAVGLFKNDVLIDILGTFNGGTANYAKDVTLRRKPSVLSPNTLYTVAEWDSFATDSFDNLGSHTIDGGSTQDTTAPSVPANVLAFNITQNTVDLSWDASSDNIAVTGYDVYQNGSLLASTSNTNYSVVNLTESTGYTFSVLAKDAAGNSSALSTVVNVTTLDPIDIIAPSTPANVMVSNVAETTVDLSWTASTDNVAVTGYDIYQDGVLFASTATTNYVVDQLMAETTYGFAVTAKDEAGNVSAVSEVVYVTTNSLSGGSTTVLSESYFETGWDGWTDGGGDCARYSGSRSFEGSYSIRLRDDSGTRSAMTSPNHDLTGFDSVEVSFSFYSYSMENGEDFWLRFYDGSSWATIETWASGTDFDNDNFYSATVTLDATNYTFASNSQFRFQADASANADHIYIDQVVITGINGNPAARGVFSDVQSAITHEGYLNTDEFDMFEEDFRMYPNPVSGSVLNIQLANESNEYDVVATYRIVSMLGQVVANGQLTADSVQVDNLQAGIYILEINDGEETMTRKFVKK